MAQGGNWQNPTSIKTHPPITLTRTTIYKFMNSKLATLFECLLENEREPTPIHLTPSENVLSPLARLPFLLDVYNRYYLDDLRLFGRWFFPAGQGLGEIEESVLKPLLREITGAQHVNVRPISGINGMTVALASLTQPGHTIMSVAPDAGGHVSTRVVAERLGLNVVHLPMMNAHDIDLECLSKTLKQKTFQLVYLDQSVFLYPIDTMAVREVIDRVSPRTLLHYDSSHVNGLIFGKALSNPLDSGATSFGGSTHKTFPGPHKAFLATNDETIAKRFQATTDHFVSHHHMADVFSLAIALIEFRDCGGEQYAGLCMENARTFAKTLMTRGLRVGGRPDNPTGCHQVWVEVPESNDVVSLVNRLKRVGILANNFSGLPGIPRPAFRLSSAELTRRGAEENDVLEIAYAFSEILLNKESDDTVTTRVQRLRNKLVRPHFCFGQEDFLEFGMSSKTAEFLGSMVGDRPIFPRA